MSGKSKTSRSMSEGRENMQVRNGENFIYYCVNPLDRTSISQSSVFA